MIINGFLSKAVALRHLRAQGFSFTSLLASPESNPKVAKNGKIVDVLTAPLHLAPFNLSGFQVCAQASAGCAAACLHTAGNPVYMAQKDKSRKEKTVAYFKHRDAFLALLTFEIAAHVRKCERMGQDAGVRLNATSDLPWELREVTIESADVFPTQKRIMDIFPMVQFYDYTKITKRAIAFAQNRMPSNYHLTFSRTESNDDDCGRVLAVGGSVAVVYSRQRYKETIGFVDRIGGQVASVIDGDAHDFRPADPRGSIIALKAKGDARKDESGFVLA